MTAETKSLDEIAVCVEDHSEDRKREHRRLDAHQDSLLVALSDREPSVDMAVLRKLPPWRAVMIARIAEHVGVLSHEALVDLVNEAQIVGGMGELKQL